MASLQLTEDSSVSCLDYRGCISSTTLNMLLNNPDSLPDSLPFPHFITSLYYYTVRILKYAQCIFLTLDPTVALLQ